MQLKHYKSGSVGKADFDASAFGDKILYRTLKDAVYMYQANQRLGTVNTRGRDQVAGSNKKPWKQKHTGRARAGDRKSPIWRGGGTVFGPKPRDYSFHMPIRARRVALRSALAGKFADGEVALADLGSFTNASSKPSSKEARKLLASLGYTTAKASRADKRADKKGQTHRRALLVVAKHDDNAWKSFRNFPGVEMRAAQDVNALDVLNGGLIVAERAALDVLAERVSAAKTSHVSAKPAQ
jgi:large subunit ribosomal protein L4